MVDKDFILEHEILKMLYIKTSFFMAGYPRSDGKTVIMAKRDYRDATLYFGTLVDMLNCPEKYKDSMNSFQGLEMPKEEINTEKYNYGQVSNAIEVLEFNAQVIDKVIEKTSLQSGSRKITLTNKGAIDYRTNFYKNKIEKEALQIRQSQSVIETNNSVKSTNYWVKRTSIISVAVAFVTLLYVIGDYYKDSQKIDLPSQEQIQKLPQKLDSISKRNRKIAP